MYDLSGLLFHKIIRDIKTSRTALQEVLVAVDWKLEAASFLLFPTLNIFHPPTQLAVLSDSWPTPSVCLRITKVYLSYPLLTVNTWLACAFSSYHWKLHIYCNCFLQFCLLLLNWDKYLTFFATATCKCGISDTGVSQPSVCFLFARSAWIAIECSLERVLCWHGEIIAMFLPPRS